MATRYGLVLTAALALTSLACGDDDTQTYEGTSRVNLAGRAVALESGDGEERVFVVGNGVEWRGMDESWREDGTAECLPPGSEGAEVVLRAVEVDGRGAVGVLRAVENLGEELLQLGDGDRAGLAEYIGHTSLVRRYQYLQ